MAGGTTPDAFVPSAYLNGFIVYPGAVSQILWNKFWRWPVRQCRDWIFLYNEV